MSTVKVSVIMPVYNGELYIHNAINSLLAQTLVEWELIIINDGSTDRTAAIVRSYKDSQIKLIEQLKIGKSSARNLGLANSKGDYIVFLDADDILLPIALYSNVEILERIPDYGVVYSDGEFCFPDLKPIARLSEYRQDNVVGNVINSIVIQPLLNASNCAMIRKKVIDDNSIKFDTNLNGAEDWDFFINLATVTNFAYNPEITCKYRIHDASSTVINDLDRQRYLGHIRKKVLNSNIFPNLPIKVRYKIINQLLFYSLKGSINEQISLVSCDQFNELPNIEKAKVLRLLTSDWLIESRDMQIITKYLGWSFSLNKTDIKTWTLRAITFFPPSFARTLISTRRSMNRFYTQRALLSPFQRLQESRPSPKNTE